MQLLSADSPPSSLATLLKSAGRRVLRNTLGAAASLGRRLRAVAPAGWFLLGFALLLLAFLLALLIQPSAVGRGGR
jgi:hypothetical protein